MTSRHGTPGGIKASKFGRLVNKGKEKSFSSISDEKKINKNEKRKKKAKKILIEL